MIIYVGSTRAAKVEGARSAIAAIATIDPRFKDVEVRARDVSASAPRMPLSEGEIVAGARRRAVALLEMAARDGASDALAIGLEGGLGLVASADGPSASTRRYALRTWASATDGRRWGDGAGGAVALPDDLADEVLAGRELGDVIDARAGAGTRSTRGAWGVLTRDLIGRRDAFRTAVIAALAPFYNRELYQDTDMS